MTPSDARTVEYTDLTDPTEEQIQQIIGLYRDQGWWQPGDDQTGRLVPGIITGSHCFVIATDGGSIVGMGRAISDGMSDAYIQDLTVRIDRRKEGIGQRILETLLERLHASGIRWIGLIAEPGSGDLYRRAGFRDMTGSTPMLMIGEP
ncbi:MAG: GNAT family N-acetyltransferase [Thermodesulfobacteriota bacterium]